MLLIFKFILSAVLFGFVLRAGFCDLRADYRRAANNLWAALFAVLALGLLASGPA
jgi:hypothetical protein